MTTAWKPMAAVLPLLLVTPASAQNQVAATDVATPPSLSQPYRLRGDAIGQARTPTGILMLEGQSSSVDWLRAEALIWGRSGELGEEADALVARITIREPDRRAEIHLGRMIVNSGAIRPIHMDGADGVVRLPWHMSLQAFGGYSVEPRFEERDYDWLAGGRVAQSIPGWLTVGAAYLQRRDAGRLSDQEVGGDLVFTPLDGLDLVTRASWDLINPGFSEALGTVSVNASDAWRFELHGSHRSASRILPATSLFSVLGDTPAQRVGLRVRWRAAPRLDVIADGGARTFDEQLGETALLRLVLRLDDFGASRLSGQISRYGGPASVAFTGVRGALQWRLARAWLLAAEAEVVRPDQSDVAGEDLVTTNNRALSAAPDRGAWWPWGLLALEYQPSKRWVFALAIEGSATSELEGALDGLLRVTWLGGPQ